jgi:Ran GTPase-activating protein (RanGAP) involved in mRNA processing and transport
MTEEEHQVEEAYEHQRTDPITSAQKRVEHFLLDRVTELTPPDLRTIETESEEIGDDLIEEAATRVVNGELAPENFQIAARAREILAELSRWQRIVQETQEVSDVREIDPESGEIVT